jgi:hypothetical protein
MTRAQVAFVREQGVEFAVVVVGTFVMLRPKAVRDEMVAVYTREFGCPAVLMAQDPGGAPTYYGRDDLVDFLSGVSVEQLPWREFTLAA